MGTLSYLQSAMRIVGLTESRYRQIDGRTPARRVRAVVLDSDALVAELYESDRALRHACPADFGPHVIRTACRQAALRAALVIKTQSPALEAIVHPAVQALRDRG